MPIDPASKVIQQIRRTVLIDGAGLSDGRLLDCVIEKRDEDAFAILVRRHGPMVWGVCRRLLPNEQDAEDAFQATFLVLVRKAATIVPRALVGNWLYGVAYQTAVRVRSTNAKRWARERQVHTMPEPEATVSNLWDDLQPLLDQELSRLPDKYRLPVVLCDLEGKSYQEAAQQLGCPAGTFGARLARARRILAKRLARHGFAVSGGALATVLSQQAVSAEAPLSLAVSTINAVAVSERVLHLAEGVMRTMLLTKLKSIIAVFVIVLGFGGWAVVWSGQGQELARQVPKSTTQKNEDEKLKKLLLELDELWWQGDVNILRKLAADDLITVSGVGRYDKASLILAASNCHAVDWKKRNIEISHVSRDVAIVTYLYDCKIVLRNGTPVQNCRNRRVSMTWVNRNGPWVVVFTQETILPGGE